MTKGNFAGTLIVFSINRQLTTVNHPFPRPLFQTTNFAPDYNFGAEKLREFEN